MYYIKPTLENLSIGARLKFIREHRGINRKIVAQYFGYGGETPDQTIRRHENNERKPDDKNLREYLKLYNVSSNALKDYDFIDPVDIIYVRMWLEEEMPYSAKEFDCSRCKLTPYNMNVINGINEWKKMREKLDNNEISCEEYIDWKLNFEIVNPIK